MADVWSANNGWTTTGGENLQLNVLLHCRTVVESASTVATGLLTHIDGEWFEVEISEFNAFQLGERVKMTIYSPVGIQIFHSSVFAKYEGAIAIIQPPEVKRRYEEKRSHSRVEVEGTLHIISAFDEAGNKLELAEPMDWKLRNISVAGVGLEAPDLPIVQRFEKLLAKIDLGFTFECELEIVRKDAKKTHVEVGARMNLTKEEMMRPLRAFILQQQVSQKVKSREEDIKRRSIARV